MLIPSKYEDLNNNPIVVGSEIIRKLKKREYDVELLYTEIDSYYSIGFDNFLNVLTYLWLADVINCDNSILQLNK